MLLEQGLEGMFYIICVNEDTNWWQLRKTDDHQVVACGVGKDFVMKALKTQVERYKTQMELQRHWSSLEYIKPLKPQVKAHRTLEYEVVKDTYATEISTVVNSLKPQISRRRRGEDNTPHYQEEEVKDDLPKIGSTIRRRRLVRK